MFEQNNEEDKSNQSQKQLKSSDQDPEKILEKSSHVFQNLQVKCAHDEQAGFYCSEQQCCENAVICNNKKCQCQKLHQQCSDFTRVNSFHNKINKNVVQVEQNLIKKIQMQIDQVIDQISNLLTKLKEKIKRFGLTSGQIYLIDQIRDHFINQENNKSLKKQQIQDQYYVTGQKLYNFKKEFPKQKNTWFQTSLNQYQNLIKQTYKNLQPYFNSICYTLETIHAKLNPKKQFKSYFNSSKVVDYYQKKTQNSFPDIVKLSSIISKNINFQDVSSFQRIFYFEKNTNNHFNKLLQTCLNQSNLLFLIKNNYNKKMGFFLSSQFNRDYLQHKPDQKMNTFIFSITQAKYFNIRSSSIVYRTVRQNQSTRIQIGDAYLNPSQKKSKAGFLLVIPNLFANAQAFTAQLLFAGEQFYSQYYSNNKTTTYDKVNGINKNQNISGLQVVSLQVYKLQFKQSYYNSIQQLNHNFNKRNQVPKSTITNVQPKPPINPSHSLFGNSNNQGSLFDSTKNQKDSILTQSRGVGLFGTNPLNSPRNLFG